MVDIDSLSSEVQDTDSLFTRWNTWALVFVALTAIAAAGYFITSFVANKKAAQLSKSKDELIRATDEQRKSDIEKVKIDAEAQLKLETERVRIEGENKLKIETERVREEAKTEETRIETEANAKIEEARNRADVQIAGAKQETQRVALDVAKQQERAAKAERDLLELQARIQPRRLLPEQSRKLLELLKANPKGPIDITCMHGDAESCALAAQIVTVLRDANWQIDSFDSPIGWGPSPVPFDGMAIFIHNAKKPPVHGNSLLQSLNEVGLATAGIENVDISEGKIHLLVGVKPLEQKRRIITAEQRTQFLKLAQGFPKGKIKVVGVITDAEAMAFAAQLIELLRDSGWIVDDTKDETLTHAPVGVSFSSGISGDRLIPSDSSMARFTALKSVLEYVGLVNRSNFNPNLSESEVVLIVGPHFDPRAVFVR